MLSELCFCIIMTLFNKETNHEEILLSMKWSQLKSINHRDVVFHLAVSWCKDYPQGWQAENHGCHRQIPFFCPWGWHLGLSSLIPLLISKPHCGSTVHGVKLTHKWAMRRDLHSSGLRNKPHWASSITLASTSVGFKTSMPVAQRQNTKTLNWCSARYCLCALDEEKLGAKMQCSMGHI